MIPILMLPAFRIRFIETELNQNRSSRKTHVEENTEVLFVHDTGLFRRDLLVLFQALGRPSRVADVSQGEPFYIKDSHAK
jgi:hypothetical protein